MRRVNFLANAYRLEPVRNDKEAGICDPAGENRHIQQLIRTLPINGLQPLRIWKEKIFNSFLLTKTSCTIEKMVRKSLLVMG